MTETRNNYQDVHDVTQLEMSLTSTLRIPQEWPLNGYDPFIGDMLETAGSTMTQTLGNSRSNVEPFWNQPGSNL